MAIIAGNVPDNPLSQVTPLEAPRQVQPRLDVRASPEDFGSQVGQALQKTGSEAGQVAQQWNGLIAETQANQNEVAYIQAQGNLRAKYNQYEGLRADQMRPQYEADSQALQQKYRENLSPIAQKLYDNNTRRYLANDISAYAGYSATQVKQANLNSHKAIVDQTIGMASDASRVTDPTKFGADLGTLKVSANAIAEQQGITATATGFDKDTQTYTFPDTPEGKAQQASYQDVVDKSQTPYQVAAVKTIANTPGLGPSKAADWIQQNDKLLTPMAKAETQQYLAPKMINENIDAAINKQNAQVDSGWQQNILNRTPNGQPDLLGVIHANEGFTGKIGRDSNGANVINGVNDKAFPQDYAAISAAYGKSKEAGGAATNEFYQKNIIDKYNIRSLPANTQAIVADGLVNHGDRAFGQSLIKAAQNGASPQQLIDMRRAEYQRLADADTDGSKGYASSLKGWNSRLDNLQKQQSGTYANKAEYLESIKDDYVKRAVDETGYPDNLAVQQAAQKRAELNINAQITNAKAALKNDTDTIEKAINGSMTNGKIPMTVNELNAIPGVQPIVDRVQREQGDFYQSITTRIAKAQHADATQNSPNAYDAVLSSLNTDLSRDGRISYLSKRLGSDNPGLSISQKDFNDAKPSVDWEKDTSDTIHDEMIKISAANGNIDGKGQERAVNYYNEVANALKANNAKGDNKKSESSIIRDINEKYIPPSPLKQWINRHLGQQSQQQPQSNIPTATGPKGEKMQWNGTAWIPQ